MNTQTDNDQDQGDELPPDLSSAQHHEAGESPQIEDFGKSSSKKKSLSSNLPAVLGVVCAIAVVWYFIFPDTDNSVPQKATNTSKDQLANSKTLKLTIGNKVFTTKVEPVNGIFFVDNVRLQKAIDEYASRKVQALTGENLSSTDKSNRSELINRIVRAQAESYTQILAELSKNGFVILPYRSGDKMNLVSIPENNDITDQLIKFIGID